MAIVQDLLDEHKSIAAARVPWEAYWREIAMYVLPHTQSFDSLLSSNVDAAINAVVSLPVASRRSKDLYDMTSVWAIERLTAGMLSLKTPESHKWQDITTDDLFGNEPSHEEKVALERLRDYLFRVRSSPRSGFWPAHRAALRSMCGFGDGWVFVEELPGVDARVPYLYHYAPLPELFPAVDYNGQTNRMYRVFKYTADQACRKFTPDKVPASVLKMANDPTQRQNTVKVMHGIRPRDEGARIGKLGVRGAAFESHYAFPDDNFHVGESGFYEFPFVRYAWGNSGNSPYCEGPVAYAIAEIRSLQEMSRNELIASQTAIRPAFATAGKNYVKMNLNPGAVNPGLISPKGEQLFAPLNAGGRPDFAQAVIESRRNNVREMMYLNLWQIIVQDKNDTATEALIRAQEKGEMLGPVGISLNEGLSHMTDREVAVLGRKGAFDDGSPLAMPDSLAKRDVSPVFTSPLDRLRRIGDLVGMQRLVEFATMLAGGDPQRGAELLSRFDTDAMLEQAQEILGAPATALRPREEAQADRQQQNQMGQTASLMQMLQAGGQAAQAAGAGAGALAQGLDALDASPAARNVMGDLGGVAASGAAGAAMAGGM